jgi:fluoride ion exporter CrcB/FEX
MTPAMLLVTVGMGALGALLRWLILQALPRAPWWSLGIVNILGSAGIGVVAALPEGFWTYPLMVGLAGSLTTFSTLAIMMTPSTTEKLTRRVVAPVALHILAGILACALGFVAVGALL